MADVLIYAPGMTAGLTASSAALRRRRKISTAASSAVLTATSVSIGSTRPILSGIDIASGPAGTLVVLSGSSFDETIELVMFGAVSAGSNYSVISETELAVYVPGGGTGTVDVSVTNENGTSTLTDGWTWDTYEGGPGGGGGSIPVVSDLVPDTSANLDGSGGDSVTIIGTGFTTARKVYFDTVEVEFTLDATTPATKLVAIAPPLGDNGNYVVDVDVENLYGRSADPGSANNFTYPGMPIPSITSNTPTTGIAGTRVVITGDYFTEVTAVQIGGYDTPFNVLNDETIECWVPYGPAPEVYSEIYVINPAGTSTTHGHFKIWGTPQAFTVTPLANAVSLKWSAVSSSLHATYRVYGSPDPTNPPTNIIATTAQTSIVYPISHAAGLHWYAVSYVDEYGNEGAQCAAVPAVSLETVADVIADEAIDAMSMFAASIRPPKVVDALPDLPDTDYPEGATVFLTTDHRLYRNGGGGPNINGDTYEKTWYDLVGSNDATLTGFPTPCTTSSGWAGNGTPDNPYRLVFAGTDDRAELAALSEAGFTDKTYTLEAWYRTTTVASGGLVAWGSGSGGSQHYGSISVSSTGKPLTNYSGSGGSGVTLYAVSANATLTYADGKWHHLIGTLDGTTLKIYCDGVLYNTGTTASDTMTVTRSRLGANGYETPSAYFTGDIACARVYDHALSAAEVTTNFGTGPTGVGYKATGLLHHWNAKFALETNAWVPLVDPAESGGPISTDSLVANSIKAGMISVGAVGADQIAANTIGAKHLIIANLDNLMPNPNSEQSPAGKDVLETSADVDYRGVNGADAYSGSYCRRLTGLAGGTVSYMLTNWLPAHYGEEYFLSYRGKLKTASNSAWIEIVSRTAAAAETVTTIGSVTTASYPANPVTGSHVLVSGDVEVALRAKTTSLATANFAYFDEIFFRRKNEGSLIVDGSITADHIESNTLVATTISGGTISGGTITGTTVNVTGSLVMDTGGVLQSSTSTNRIEITNANADRIWFYTGHHEQVTGSTIASISCSNTLESGILFFQGPNIHSGGRAELIMGSMDPSHGSDPPWFSVSAGTVMIDATSGTTIYGAVEMDGNCEVAGKIYPSVDFVSGSSSDGVWIQDSNTVSRRYKIFFNSNSGEKKLHLRQEGSANFYTHVFDGPYT